MYDVLYLSKAFISTILVISNFYCPLSLSYYTLHIKVLYRFWIIKQTFRLNFSDMSLVKCTKVPRYECIITFSTACDMSTYVYSPLKGCWERLTGGARAYNMQHWSFPPGPSGRHLADDIFRCIFVNEKFCVLIKISRKFVPKGPIDNKILV